MSRSSKVGFLPKYYEVGHKKPPRQSQFVKGKSGNPKGRPKSKQYATVDMILAQEFQSLITVTVGGRKKSMTTAEALVKTFIQQALKGDKSTQKEILQKLSNLPAPPDEKTWIYRVGPEQEKIFDTFLKEAEEYRQETREDSENN